MIKQHFNLAIIGGGASGLACAIEFKRNFPDKTAVIIEKLNRVGKKILVTGNGRCNLTNLNASSRDYNCPDFVSPAMGMFTPQNNIDFFRSIGLLTYTDSENRVYPHSNTASSVLNCLRFECERLGVAFITDTPVREIKKSGHFIINNTFSSDKAVICTGGRSSPSHGSDGSGYELLKQLGHKIKPAFPSLVQICTQTDFPKFLKGIRVKCSASLTENGAVKGQSRGEILFTDYGISGIAALDLSSYIAKSNPDSSKHVSLDMAENLKHNQLVSYIRDCIKRSKDGTCENLLSGLLASRVGQAVMKYCSINLSRKASSLSSGEIEKIASAVKDFRLNVTGTKGFDSSQVTSGGAMLNEFNKNTLESKKIKGLYCCGEVLDIDGLCGGFNLQWAWSSGRLAGLCKSEVTNEKH